MNDEFLLESIDLLSEAMRDIARTPRNTVREREILGRLDRVLAALTEEASKRGLRQSGR